MAAYKIMFGKNSKLTSYDGLSVGDRKKRKREFERERRAELLRRIGESNLKEQPCQTV